MLTADSIFVEYRVHWRTGGIRPGAFRGMHSGPGERFRTSVPLHTRADPRRLDVRATLRDPLNGIWVRDFEQQSALNVIVLADVSASMGYVGRRDKMEQVRRIAVSLARTAWRNADAFGFFAAGDTMPMNLSLPTRLNRGAADWLDRRLRDHVANGTAARGLLQAAAQLPHRRSLVFLVSDFHWPEPEIKDVLRALTHHAIVPIVLWDPGETDETPRRGIAVLRDLETGARRFVWLRRGLLLALGERRREREKRLRRLCAMFGCTPFFVRDKFEPVELTRYFLETFV